ncbi:MAG: hypothetical protein A3I44_03965 [Candidatus Sungbacteria bacterium RIFCSPLOWO2_02_FULL_51_17]|uniref:SnoaL-like domain-containing protein n=1 Tax=Candidatus Sungbacteria bacterium RIFCSPHIGHO2_02_FULL_51_29 TaxID=1802273 RepID=A0A1G2KUV7_9BACT|nr:MAG: hypothetical protein A2676_02485 [Candidatus Sungbacteria bacterium RIFCSPHIGHO2_01_FULL_51_22]OHA02241.1 MAG: hypothetical protein A3C16_04045 [Candidatus Sungbacteria bacterium RIFCSPHIGHO2_02_FULL_51_29]OHA06067.1 MAG: hypothetical protein A3B29_05350 [Candidatus Sungbacteria bacterium RIFCSPLOWO2_01_FULL_51_34]OHA11242.1 MAG: hypothetical protein A3I44_03965 [Candidatus Sungbacteria bacterium RIFCSPLOWO2_02_FULL_51_17]
MHTENSLVRLVVFSVLVFLIAVPAMVVAETAPSRDELLQKRADDMCANIEQKNFNAIWEALAASTQEANGGVSRAFALMHEHSFGGKTVFCANAPKIRRINEWLGLSHYSIVVVSDSDTTVACDGMVWVWEREHWYFFQHFSCAREQEAIDSMMKWSDIKNAPK